MCIVHASEKCARWIGPGRSVVSGRSLASLVPVPVLPILNVVDQDQRAWLGDGVDVALSEVSS